MYRILRAALISSLAVAASFAQPVISSIYNAASYAAAPVSGGSPVGNNNIAQGAIFVLFGTGLGPTTLLQAPSLPLTTTLPASSGTSISITSGGTTISAFILYTSAGQVAAILPSSALLGAATVKLTYNGQTSAAAAINVVATDVGIFTQNSQGTGPASALVFSSATNYNFLGLTTPAQPGQTVELYGTGLGAITGADNVAPGPVSVGSNVTVNIAGVTTPVAYAGRAPQFPGLDQINFVVPGNVPTGCYIPAEVTASGRPSSLFYLSIAPAGGGACTHPLGLPASALSTLDSNGTINFGMFQMLAAVVIIPAQGLGGLFENANANATFQTFSQILLGFGGYNYPVAAGSCATLDTLQPASGFTVPNLAALGGKELKSGSTLTLSSSNGTPPVTIQPNTGGGYLGEFLNTLGQGTWTLTGAAGPDVAAFTASTNLPQNLTWTNVGNFGLPPRSTGLTITWTGGSVNAQSVVTITGSSVIINPTNPSKSRGKAFFCNAPASAGSFQVPASITMQLPASTPSAADGEVSFGQLGIFAGGGSTFTANLASGKPLDGGFLAYGEAQTISVNYQQ